VTDRPVAVDRWIEWARARGASVEIVVRYQIKRGRLVRVVLEPPHEDLAVDVLDSEAHTSGA